MIEYKASPDVVRCCRFCYYCWLFSLMLSLLWWFCCCNIHRRRFCFCCWRWCCCCCCCCCSSCYCISLLGKEQVWTIIHHKTLLKL